MAYAIIDKNPAVRQIIVDSDAEIETLTTTRFAPGSTALVPSTNKTYMLSPSGDEWILLSDK